MRDMVKIPTMTAPTNNIATVAVETKSNSLSNDNDPADNDGNGKTFDPNDDGIGLKVTTNASSAAAPPPRAKINISLKKKSKLSSSKKSNSFLRQLKNDKSLLTADGEYSTVAEEAERISRRRREEGTLLVIPCTHQRGINNEKQKQRPLLAGRLALLGKGDDGGKTSEADDGDYAGGAVAVAAGTETGIATNNTSIKNRSDDTIIDDNEEALQQLVQTAKAQKDRHDATNSGRGGAGLVIAVTSQNNINDTATTGTAASNNERTRMNDEELFQQELSHHAADVNPTSEAYATVAIGDFGSALLRGMGWTGNDASKVEPAKGKAGDGKPEEEAIAKPRPYRLGLGAAPLAVPLPSSKPSGRGGGIHRRARRPEEAKRDMERTRRQEEAELREEERKRLDVQCTLQKGSVVCILQEEDDGDDIDKAGGRRRRNETSATKRALVVRTTGVPGLNQILIQMEGSPSPSSVSKRSVALCSWVELDANPFQQGSLPQLQLRRKKEQQSTKEPESHGAPSSSSARKCEGKSNSHSEDDGDTGSRKREYKKEGGGHKYYSDDDIDDDSRDDSSRRHRHGRSKKHKGGKRRRHHRDDRSRDRHHRRRSRSDSRERGRRRRKDSSGRGREDHDRDSPDAEGHSRRSQEKRRSKHRRHSSPHRSTAHTSQSSQQKPHSHWLIPHIRVRLVSKKMPKYYLQKGIVQDVLLSTTQQSKGGGSSNAKAVLLMENGQVLDNVPERYLETALPKSSTTGNGCGGNDNVIVLEGPHRWKKGRLLERCHLSTKSDEKDGGDRAGSSSSSPFWGIVQLEEDLEVVRVSLDSIAEWCGRALETDG